MILKIVIIYFILINIFSFFAYGLDKSFARKDKYRISESFLLSLSLVGGFIGSFFGMNYFHHKTKKVYFKIIITLSFLIYSGLLYFIYNRR
ncbi:MAG: DUF1294 domain-containing protein [Lagierella massiliensis]|nr:DUF1294 domain-containing protein [Lagierella massiliensis]